MKEEKLLYQWGKISYIVFFPTPGIPIFLGGNSSSGKSWPFFREKEGKMGI